MEQAGEVHEGLQVNVLDVLHGLVGDSEQVLSQQEDASREYDDIEKLKAEALRWQKRKRELSQTLGAQQIKTVKELILTGLEEKVVKHKAQSLPEEAIARMPIVAKKRKLDLIKIAQAICGLTFFEHEGKELAMRFETCFQGKYYDHYHILLDLDKNEKLKISHHTIPYYIPLDRIQKKYLNSDITTFVNIVSDYLNSFVSRREQIIQLGAFKDADKYFNRLVTSDPADFTTIEFAYEEDKYFMMFSYESLLNTYPSKVEIYTLDKDKKKLQVYDMVPIFTENYLKDAFKKLFPGLNENDET